MPHDETKQRLYELLTELPIGKLATLLHFALFLQRGAASVDERAWERDINMAENYWFSLPQAARQNYAGRAVAVTRIGILDADTDLNSLHARIQAHYPNQPVLYHLEP